MTPKSITPQPAVESTDEIAEHAKERNYAALSEAKELAFDPLKDLNLPASYEEVTLRFRRLQSGKDMETLN
jgi:hypothetical protein